MLTVGAVIADMDLSEQSGLEAALHRDQRSTPAWRSDFKEEPPWSILEFTVCKCQSGLTPVHHSSFKLTALALRCHISLATHISWSFDLQDEAMCPGAGLSRSKRPRTPEARILGIQLSYSTGVFQSTIWPVPPFLFCQENNIQSL